MLTEKMAALKGRLQRRMYFVFPHEDLAYIFSGKITEDDVLLQVMMECCKRAYDQMAEKRALRSFVKDEGADMDSFRMMVQRSYNKIRKYREMEYAYYAMSGIRLDGLLSTDMNDYVKRREGHKVNAFQYWEDKNVREMNWVWSVVERKFAAKNYTSKDMKDDLDQYEKIILDLRENGDSILFPLAMITLEWKYSTEFLYSVAEEMTRRNIKVVPDLKNKLQFFCGSSDILAEKTIPGSLLREGANNIVQHRMLITRGKLVPDFLSNADMEIHGNELNRFLKASLISTLLWTDEKYNHEFLPDWMIKNAQFDDWLSVLQEYSRRIPFVEKKELSLKTVRNMKYLYDAYAFDWKNPGFCS